MEINNHIPEGYKSPCIIVVAGDAKTDFPNPELLNGYGEDQTDFVEYIDIPAAKIKDGSYMDLLWNKADMKLYSVNKFVTGSPLNEEQMKSLGEQVSGQWSDGVGEVFEQNPVMQDDEGNDVYVSPWHIEQELHVSQMPIEIPKGHYWLGSLFDTPEKQVMYEEFMVEPIIFDRFVGMLKTKKIKVPEGVTTTTGLPIHKKDRHTGEILISDKVLKVFMQYQFARNYLSFDVGTKEYDLGKVLLLAPKFCEYLMVIAEKQSKGKEVNMDNYFEELGKAIKFIESRPKLFKLYKDDLLYESKADKPK